MRIAIYLGDLSPPSGGAFTFQDDVFRVLMEGDGARRHSLVIYSNLSREQTARYDRADLLWERTRGELRVPAVHRQQRALSWIVRKKPASAQGRVGMVPDTDIPYHRSSLCVHDLGPAAQSTTMVS